MKATVLIDNIAKDKLNGEWGLSVFIRHSDKRILLVLLEFRYNFVILLKYVQ